jgi:hypothetical protein
MTGPIVSQLFVGGEILFGFSLTVLVGALIATLRDQTRTGRR